MIRSSLERRGCNFLVHLESRIPLIILRVQHRWGNAGHGSHGPQRDRPSPMGPPIACESIHEATYLPNWIDGLRNEILNVFWLNSSILAWFWSFLRNKSLFHDYYLIYNILLKSAGISNDFLKFQEFYYFSFILLQWYNSFVQRFPTLYGLT